MTSPLYLIAEIHPDPQKLDEAFAAFTDLISATKKEQGCLLYDLVIEDDNPGIWIMLEKWESKEAWDLHMASEHVKHMNEISSNFTVAETLLRFFDRATADPFSDRVTSQR